MFVLLHKHDVVDVNRFFANKFYIYTLNTVYEELWLVFTFCTDHERFSSLNRVMANNRLYRK